MIMKTNFKVGDRVKINPKKSYNLYTEYALDKTYVIHDIFGNPSGYPGAALLKEEEGDISGGIIKPIEALELVEPDAGICEKENFESGMIDKMEIQHYSLNVSKIIFNPPATIVFWDDGTKTVVKCSAEDEYNKYYGFLCALGKKMFGTNSHLKKLIDEKAERHYPEDEFSKQIEQLEKFMNKIAKQYELKEEE